MTYDVYVPPYGIIQQPHPQLLSQPHPQLLLLLLLQQQLLPQPLPQPNRTIRMMMSQRQLLLFPQNIVYPFLRAVHNELSPSPARRRGRVVRVPAEPGAVGSV